jgi:predicted ATPase/DNA-binding SARP family transcriptional activator
MPVHQVSLRVTLFGGAQIRMAGNTQIFTSDKRYQLLAFLASQDGWVSRDRLAALFWSDTPTANAKQNLRRLLGRTRDLPWLSTLEIDRTRLRWQVATDVADFRTALARCDWQTVNECYTGPFLDGFESYDNSEFAHWLMLERERFHTLWRDALFHQVDELRAEKAYGQAMALLKKALEHDGFDEDALASYLDLALRTGDTTAAKSLYQAFAKVLKRELGIEPSSATQQLALRLDTGKAATFQQPAPVILPTDTTSFIGRDLELAEINNLLSKPLCQLLTLLGPGGVGKTRLAVQAAKELAGKYADGVIFVALESLKRPQEIPGTLIEALGASPEGQDDPLDQLIQHIGDKQLLLILDNFEQLLGGVSLLSQFITHCPGLQLMVTSRERLGLEQEWLLTISGLAYPGPEITPEDALAYDAVALFTERAQRVRPTFMLNRVELPAVIDICHLVEGFPLALELAAVWVRLLSCADIAGEIRETIDFLTQLQDATTPRHQSIRAVFNYTWQLLTPAEQTLLKKLAVFRGGFSLEAAKIVAGASIALLAALVDKSLIRAVTPSHYDLHSLIAQYAREELSKDTTLQQTTETAHALYFLQMVQKIADAQGEQRQQLLHLIESYFDNLVAAWSWLLTHERVREIVQATSRLSVFFDITARYRDGLLFFQQAIDKLSPTTSEHSVALGYVLLGQAKLYHRLGSYQLGIKVAEQSLLLLRPHKETFKGIIANLTTLGNIRRGLGQFADAKANYQEALRLTRNFNNQPEALAPILSNLGSVENDLSNFATAKRLFEQALAIDLQSGDRYGATVNYVNLGNVLYLMNEAREAEKILKEGLQLATEISARHAFPYFAINLGAVTFRLGDIGQAQHYYHQTLELAQEFGDRTMEAYALVALGWAALKRDGVTAARLYLLQGLNVAWTIQLIPQVLRALLGLTRTQMTEHPVQATSLVYFILHHSALSPETREQAQDLLQVAASSLTTEHLLQAEQESKALVLEHIVPALLMTEDS